MPFNRQSAVTYAQKYALQANPNYPRDPENDCTNFVSQAMLAGGWTMIGGTDNGGDRKSENVWWYGKRSGISLMMGGRNWSWTWANAAFFSRFLAISQRGIRVDGPKILMPGDIIQIADSSRVHHTMIVTGKTSGGLLVSYHSVDRRDLPLSQVQASSPGETFLYWKISDAKV